MWYGHDGAEDGSPRWRGPRVVGNGWNSFKSIFSGGEYVVYGILPNGDLLWYRHHDAPSGGTNWPSAVKVGWGFADMAKVFSGGYGIIYAIRKDGVLLRYKHLGYLTGTFDWEQGKEIGTGWGGFQEVVASGDGVLYAFTHDGKILWYRYGERKPPTGGTPWVGGSTSLTGGHMHMLTGPFWEGPVEIRHFPGFRNVFALMDMPGHAVN
ncbi:hypothetical protein PUR_43900 [Paenibacillus sp. URB8-2]|nr:hypothetical protein PUR_43900 [Paenibacillus sp. URB8-2]